MSVNLEQVEKEANEKALLLTEKLGEPIHAHVINAGEQGMIIGFFKQPNRSLKMYALDMSTNSLSQANDTILKSCLIVDESDKRILEDKPENDAIYLTFNMYASTLVELYNLNIQKKN
jgi:hypothetical protein